MLTEAAPSSHGGNRTPVRVLVFGAPGHVLDGSCHGFQGFHRVQCLATPRASGRTGLSGEEANLDHRMRG